MLAAAQQIYIRGVANFVISKVKRTAVQILRPGKPMRMFWIPHAWDVHMLNNCLMSLSTTRGTKLRTVIFFWRTYSHFSWQLTLTKVTCFTVDMATGVISACCYGYRCHLCLLLCFTRWWRWHAPSPSTSPSTIHRKQYSQADKRPFSDRHSPEEGHSPSGSIGRRRRVHV